MNIFHNDDPPQTSIALRSSEEADGASQASLVAVLGESTFDRAVSAARPTVVAFGGPGCTPCETVNQHLRDLAGEHAGKLKVAKVGLDVAPSFVGRFSLQTMPTLIVFVAGEEQKRITGVTDKVQLVRALAGFLA